MVSSVNFGYKFGAKCPQECTNQALKTAEEAKKSYMAEVIAESCF
jgi:hypothetical protein